MHWSQPFMDLLTDEQKTEFARRAMALAEDAITDDKVRACIQHARMALEDGRQDLVADYAERCNPKAQKQLRNHLVRLLFDRGSCGAALLKGAPS